LILEGNREVEICKEYNYLGTTLNREGRNYQEINKRSNKSEKDNSMFESCGKKHHKKEEIQYI